MLEKMVLLANIDDMVTVEAFSVYTERVEAVSVDTERVEAVRVDVRSVLRVSVEKVARFTKRLDRFVRVLFAVTPERVEKYKVPENVALAAVNTEVTSRLVVLSVDVWDVLVATNELVARVLVPMLDPFRVLNPKLMAFTVEPCNVLYTMPLCETNELVYPCTVEKREVLRVEMPPFFAYIVLPDIVL
jgi:hypothetical protein